MGERKGKGQVTVESRNMYKGPTDKDQWERGGLRVGGGGGWGWGESWRKNGDKCYCTTIKNKINK